MVFTFHTSFFCSCVFFFVFFVPIFFSLIRALILTIATTDTRTAKSEGTVQVNLIDLTTVTDHLPHDRAVP